MSARPNICLGIDPSSVAITWAVVTQIVPGDVEYALIDWGRVDMEQQGPRDNASRRLARVVAQTQDAVDRLIELSDGRTPSAAYPSTTRNMAVCVELPAWTGNAWGGMRGQPAMYAARYAVCAGVAYKAAEEAAAGFKVPSNSEWADPRVAGVSADAWPIGWAPAGRGRTAGGGKSATKTGRIVLLEHLMRVDKALPRNGRNASDIADAALLAYYRITRDEQVCVAHAEEIAADGR